MAFLGRGNYIRTSQGLRTATGSPASVSSDGFLVQGRWLGRTDREVTCQEPLGQAGKPRTRG